MFYEVLKLLYLFIHFMAQKTHYWVCICACARRRPVVNSSAVVATLMGIMPPQFWYHWRCTGDGTVLHINILMVMVPCYTSVFLFDLKHLGRILLIVVMFSHTNISSCVGIIRTVCISYNIQVTYNVNLTFLGYRMFPWPRSQLSLMTAKVN